MAYLCSYAIKFELRPGSQDSVNGAIEFVDKCFNIIKKIGIQLDKVLVRSDSGHDDSRFGSEFWNKKFELMAIKIWQNLAHKFQNI